MDYSEYLPTIRKYVKENERILISGINLLKLRVFMIFRLKSKFYCVCLNLKIFDFILKTNSFEKFSIPFSF